MNTLTIIRQNGGAYIDSRDVAVFIGKDHRNLLRDIRGYCEILMKSNELKFELINFFIESSYLDSRGRTKSCYLLTKQGCELCANKLSGTKGVLFTAAYVAKFNAMEDAEREAEIKANAKPRLSEFNNAVKNVLNGMSQCKTAPDGVMKFLRGVYEPLGIEVRNEHYDKDFYSATVIAMVLGMVSTSGRPHAHAVSAIISKLDDWQRHSVAVPYGLVGVSVRYDFEVVKGVYGWLVENGKPRAIPYLGFEYHVNYKGELPPLGNENDDEYALYRYDDIDFDVPAGHDDFNEYTTFELDEMCGEYEGCNDCPGIFSCCGNE